MLSTIVNGASLTIMQGIQDLSIRAPVREAIQIPTHLPHFYSYLQKGPLDGQFVVGGSAVQTFGADSFDPRKKWATHATPAINAVTKKGNLIKLQRIKPVDAGDPSSLRYWLDVLPTMVDEFQRNIDGSIVYGANNLPVATGVKIAGFKVKWVVTKVTPSNSDADGNQFGQATVMPGDQTDPLTSVQSQRYPILDFAVPDFGSYGNNNGIRLWSPTSKSSLPLNETLLTSDKVYPFRISCVNRASENTTPRIVETLAGEQYLDVCFKPGVINPVTTSLTYIGDVFVDAYQDTQTAGFVPVYGPFGKIHTYDNYVEQLLSDFYDAEKPFIDSFSDFKNVADETYLFNILSGMSSNATPYHSFQVVTGGNAVRLTETATVFAQGGSDGTMDESLFAQLVAVEVAEYGNPNSRLQDMASNPVSIMYDTGFPLETKYKMCNFIAERKDTFVVLVTHSTLSPELTASEESSLAIALRTRLQMFPESEFFGTSTVRGMIVGRSGDFSPSQYRGKLPLVLEVMTKAAAYMGAGNGKWKKEEDFDHGEAAKVTMFRNINVTFTPNRVRNKDWANGLNYVEAYDLRSNYFPALKTVCDNDTSVLNSFITAMGLCELEKVGDRARRYFSGVSSLSDGQLIEQVNEFVVENSEGRFADRLTIIPDAYYTAADKARGFSWTLPIKVYADSMKTVMTLSLQSHRSEELTA
jgi:hypothetical protein